jgi:hypothetical protein
LSVDEIESLAKSKGFVLRKSKLNGSKFLDLLMFTHFNQQELTLTELAIQAELRFGVSMSKQGIDNRFSSGAVDFVRAVLEKAIEKTLGSTPMHFLSRFAAAKIKDSTSFQLPPDMAGKYPGSGGSGSPAMLKIQFEYDLRTGKITDLSLHPFNRQDSTDAAETIGDIEDGELVLRDLGYVKVSTLQEIDANAFFLNRLQYGIKVFEKVGDEFRALDFQKIEQRLRADGLDFVEKKAYIGANEKFPVRLIIEALPEDRKQERLRKAKKEAQKKGRNIGKEFINRIGLNLFITNVPQDWVKAEDVRKLYTFRWQIELVFKVWKSVGEIHKVKKMKLERLECCLYAKLLWITVNWRVYWELNMFHYHKKGGFLSMRKLFKTLKHNLDGFRAAIIKGTKSLKAFIMKLADMADKYQCEKRKGKMALMDLVVEF